MQVAGLDLWTVSVIFAGVVLVGTTFISHTVGAMVILPIVQSVGEAMTGEKHPKLLVMSAALMCSGKETRSLASLRMALAHMHVLQKANFIHYCVAPV